MKQITVFILLIAGVAGVILAGVYYPHVVATVTEWGFTGALAIFVVGMILWALWQLSKHLTGKN